MPTLSNPRHERFAQELAKGKSATDAYTDAGYTGDRKVASKLATKDDVKARVGEILDRSAIRAEVTVDGLIADASKVFDLAIASGQLNAAVAAIKEKGILSGKRIERAETGKPGDFSRMNDAELREFIAERAGRVGGGLSGIGDAAATQGLLRAKRTH